MQFGDLDNNYYLVNSSTRVFDVFLYRWLPYDDIPKNNIRPGLDEVLYRRLLCFSFLSQYIWGINSGDVEWYFTDMQ